MSWRYVEVLISTDDLTTQLRQHGDEYDQIESDRDVFRSGDYGWELLIDLPDFVLARTTDPIVTGSGWRVAYLMFQRKEE